MPTEYRESPSVSGLIVSSDGEVWQRNQGDVPMPTAVKPKPLANPKFEPFPGWQLGRVSIPGSPLCQFQLHHADGTTVKLGKPTAYDKEVNAWLEQGEGMRDIYDLAVSTVDPADGIAAKLAAIGEKAESFASIERERPGRDTTIWRVHYAGWRSGLYETPDEALAEALAHFGLAIEASPPAAPAPEAGLTADHVAALRDFADRLIEQKAYGSRPYFVTEVTGAVLGSIIAGVTWPEQAPRAEPAMTTEAKFAAIQVATGLKPSVAEGIDVVGNRFYRVELALQTGSKVCGLPGDTHDEAVSLAYAKFVQPPTEEAHRCR